MLALRIAFAGLALSALVVSAVAPPAVAQTLTERQARSSVPDSRSRTVLMSDLDWLGDAESRAVEDYAKQFNYYGALAVSPGDPADTGSAVAVANYHSPQDAQRAALASCNAKRTSGGACVIVATVVPRGYRSGVPTLSEEAVDALKGDFRRMDSPKALAISPSTGFFGIARGDGGRALSTCAARAAEQGQSDCRIFVLEP